MKIYINIYIISRMERGVEECLNGVIFWWFFVVTAQKIFAEDSERSVGVSW